MWIKIKKSKWLYVLLSILMAFILWAYVVREADPPSTGEISGIPVTFSGTNILTTRNLIISEGAEQTMDLSFTAKTAIMAKLNRDSITLTVNVSNIVEPGTYSQMVEIGYPPTVNGSEIALNSKSDLSDLYVSFTVSKKESKEVPVQLEFTGSIADGYQAGEYEITPSTVSISGQQELVNQVAYAKVVLSQKDLSASYTGDLAFTYVGSDGQDLTDLNVESNVDAVHVVFPVVQNKDIPLTVDILPGGGATEADVASVVFTTPGGETITSINVSGPEDELKGLQEIDVGEIDLSQVEPSNTFTKPVSITTPFTNESGVTEVNVTVTLKEGVLATREFSVDNIVLVNKPEGFETELVTQTRLVTIRGPQAAVNAVYQGQLRIVADMSTQPAAVGRYTVPVKVYVDGRNDVGVIGEYNIVVTLSQ